MELQVELIEQAASDTVLAFYFCDKLARFSSKQDGKGQAARLEFSEEDLRRYFSTQSEAGVVALANRVCNQLPVVLGAGVQRSGSVQATRKVKDAADELLPLGGCALDVSQLYVDAANDEARKASGTQKIEMLNQEYSLLVSVAWRDAFAEKLREARFGTLELGCVQAGNQFDSCVTQYNVTLGHDVLSYLVANPASKANSPIPPTPKGEQLANSFRSNQPSMQTGITPAQCNAVGMGENLLELDRQAVQPKPDVEQIISPEHFDGHPRLQKVTQSLISPLKDLKPSAEAFELFFLQQSCRLDGRFTILLCDEQVRECSCSTVVTIQAERSLLPQIALNALEETKNAKQKQDGVVYGGISRAQVLSADQTLQSADGNAGRFFVRIDLERLPKSTAFERVSSSPIIPIDLQIQQAMNLPRRESKEKKQKKDEPGAFAYSQGGFGGVSQILQQVQAAQKSFPALEQLRQPAILQELQEAYQKASALPALEKLFKALWGFALTPAVVGVRNGAFCYFWLRAAFRQPPEAKSLPWSQILSPEGAGASAVDFVQQSLGVSCSVVEGVQSVVKGKVIGVAEALGAAGVACKQLMNQQRLAQNPLQFQQLSQQNQSPKSTRPSAETSPQHGLNKTALKYMEALEEKLAQIIAPQAPQLDGLSKQQLQDHRANVKKTMQKQLALQGVAGKKLAQLPRRLKGIQGQAVQSQVDQSTEFAQAVMGEGFCEQLNILAQPLFLQFTENGFDNVTELFGNMSNAVDETLRFLHSVQQGIGSEQAARDKQGAEKPASRPRSKPSVAISGTTKPESSALNREKLEKIFEENVDPRETLDDVSDAAQMSEEDMRVSSAVVRAVQLAASGQRRFLALAFEQASAILGRNNFKAGCDFYQFLEGFRVCDMRRIISTLLNSGFKLSQPHFIQTPEDSERIQKYLRAPVKFVLALLENDFERFHKFVPADAALMATVQMATESLLMGSKKLSGFATDHYAFGSQEECGSPIALKLLVRKLVVDREDLALWILNKGLKVSHEKIRPQEQRGALLQAYAKHQYTQDDIEALFENCALPEASFAPEKQFNTMLETKMEIQFDETGKRIKNQDLDEARQRPIKCNVAAPPLWVLVQFLRLLWENGFVSVDEIDGVIRQQVEDVFKAHIGVFYGQMKDVAAEYRDDISVHSDVSKNAGQHLVEQLAAFQKASKKFQSHSLCKHRSYQHLLAVQEHLASGSFDVTSLIPTLKTFQSPSQYFDFLLQLVSPAVAPETLQLTGNLTLCEWLVLRGETVLTQILLQKVQEKLEAQPPEVSPYLQLWQRLQMVEMHCRFQARQFQRVLDYVDEVKSNLHQVRLKALPAFNLLRARALQEVQRALYKQENIGPEQHRDVVRMAHMAYSNAMKSKQEPSDFLRGCTATGEAGFFDPEFSYNLLETLFSNLGVLQMVHKQFLGSGAVTSKAQEGFGFGSIGAQEQQDPSGKPSGLQSSGANPPQTSVAFLQRGFDMKTVRDPEEVSGNNASTDIKSLLPQAPPARLSAEELKAKKVQLRNQGISYAAEQKTARKAVQHNDSFHGASTPGMALQESQEQQQQQKMKHLVSMANAAKLALEQTPNFGPSWALFSLIQLALGNVSEARLSSSISTLLCPQAVETWIAWCACELYSAMAYGQDFSMINEFLQQITAMDPENSRIAFVWRDIEALNSGDERQ